MKQPGGFVCLLRLVLKSQDVHICIKKEYVGVVRTLEFTYGEGGAKTSELCIVLCCIVLYVHERKNKG